MNIRKGALRIMTHKNHLKTIHMYYWEVYPYNGNKYAKILNKKYQTNIVYLKYLDKPLYFL